MSTTAIVALSTAPDESTAAQLARTLVAEKLAACVNIVAKVRSIYNYQGEMCDDAEALCVIKSDRSRVSELQARLVELHPYDVPEFIVLDVAGGHAAYLAWIAETLA